MRWILELEPIAERSGDLTGIVEVKAADGNGVVLEDAMVGYVEDAGGEVQPFADGMAGRDIEGGVDRKVVGIVGAFVLPGEAIGKA